MQSEDDDEQPEETRPVKRNPMARALRDPLFRKRVERPRKGRGSYSRKGKKRGGADE